MIPPSQFGVAGYPSGVGGHKADFSLLMFVELSPSSRLNRPISARYFVGLSLRASERILVRRLESRSRQRRVCPSGRDRRNISIAC
jgi:hypothetical protein